jgi:hypothetical protein
MTYFQINTSDPFSCQRLSKRRFLVSQKDSISPSLEQLLAMGKITSEQYCILKEKEEDRMKAQAEIEIMRRTKNKTAPIKTIFGEIASKLPTHKGEKVH